MVVFTLTCFGLLLFLWLAFGGPVPLKPKGYQFTVDVPEATTLAKEADVRISGVPVGKVKDIQPDKRTGLSRVTVELEPRYGPLQPSSFFEDGRASRPLVAGTVAWGKEDLRDDPHFYTGIKPAGSGKLREGTRQRCSPSHRNASRLVARIVRLGQPRSSTSTS